MYEKFAHLLILKPCFNEIKREYTRNANYTSNTPIYYFGNDGKRFLLRPAWYLTNICTARHSDGWNAFCSSGSWNSGWYWWYQMTVLKCATFILVNANDIWFVILILKTAYYMTLKWAIYLRSFCWLYSYGSRAISHTWCNASILYHNIGIKISLSIILIWVH